MNEEIYKDIEELKDTVDEYKYEIRDLKEMVQKLSKTYKEVEDSINELIEDFESLRTEYDNDCCDIIVKVERLERKVKEII